MVSLDVFCVRLESPARHFWWRTLTATRSCRLSFVTSLIFGWSRCAR